MELQKQISHGSENSRVSCFQNNCKVYLQILSWLEAGLQYPLIHSCIRQNVPANCIYDTNDVITISWWFVIFVQVVLTVQTM